MRKRRGPTGSARRTPRNAIATCVPAHPPGGVTTSPHGEQQGELKYMHAPGAFAGRDLRRDRQRAKQRDGVHGRPRPARRSARTRRWKTAFTGAVLGSLPVHYRDPDDSFGLLTYLRSLQRVADLGPEVAVLPAHRLYNNHKFNFQTTQRAADLIRFHARRLGRILVTAGPEPQPLEDVTRQTFERRKLEAAISSPRSPRWWRTSNSWKTPATWRSPMTTGCGARVGRTTRTLRQNIF